MVRIEQHVWGMTPEGEAIILYTLRNDRGAEVRLSNYGAAIVAAFMPDREGRMADVVLGYKHPEGYFHDGAAAGKSVGRCANRIAFGRMTVEGEEYALEVNNGQNHLHGGTNNFANRVWESRVETNRVVMSLLSEDGDQGYPGELCVEAVFDFDDDCSLEITYRARTDRTTVVNLTNHVYFNLAGDGSGSVLDHELRLNASQALEMNERQIPTGRLLDVAGTPQDFRDYRPFRPGIDAEFNHIRDFKGYDHPFVIDGWRPNILGEVGCLRDPRVGPLRRGALLAAQRDDLHGQLARGRLPRDQDRRPLCGLRRRSRRVPELSRRGEPSRIPLAAAPARRNLLPEDRLPVRELLIHGSTICSAPAAIFCRGGIVIGPLAERNRTVICKALPANQVCNIGFPRPRKKGQ